MVGRDRSGHAASSKAMHSANDPCPCHSERSYGQCCQRLHDGLDVAPTPLALMRSRYAAFALGLIDYLHATWHPSTRPETMEAMDAGRHWLSLEILSTGEDGPNQGWVEFVARSKLAGRALRHREYSRFLREQGRWYYVDGDLK